jgi:ubiquinone/menaquinone biosynthesis C-methylase UbiE
MKDSKQRIIVKGHKKERYWSRFAHTYDRDGEHIVGKPILQAIGKHLADERGLGEVIEFGGGTGYFTRAIARNARHVIATDLSDKMLEIARTQLGEFQNVTVQKADCASTDFPAERFDTVLMVNLIHVIDDPARCLQESHRILRNEGLLIAVDLTSYRMDLFRTMKLAFRYLRKWGVPPRHGRNNMSPDELSSLVGSAGFEVKDVQLVKRESNALYLRSVKCAKPLST